MRLHALLDFIPFLSLVLAQSKEDVKCRCLYGEPCWPTEQDFTSLTSHLSQPLLRPVPPATACYPIDNPSGNCSDAQSHRRDSIWRADQPGAYENINFESHLFQNGSISACYLNTTLGIPCEQGNVPPIGVDARTVEDVQAAVKFAGQHNLRLVVKNTGHDYLGRSSGRNAFMIWTHHLKNITYNAEFIPEGGSKDDAIFGLTVGAGVQWYEAYTAAAQNNRFVVGGISATGSNGAAGGWIMGGGHSAFSPKFGLGVDNAVEFTIVKPNGDYAVANSHHNQDLFWALRGGGAGSWGVVISVTYKTHDLLPMILSVLNVTFPTLDAATSVATELVGLFPKLSDLGWGGYGALSNTSLLMGFMSPNVSWADVNSTILPFFDFAVNATQDPNALATTIPFANPYELINPSDDAGLQNAQEVGGLVELASRLLSRNAAEQRAEETARLLLSFDFVGINFVAGGAVGLAEPDSVALNPGWRKAVAHVYTSGNWEEGTSAETIKEIQRGVARHVRALDPISPDSTTYMNEASLYEPDFKKSFFGDHYDKLRAIKQIYDPNSLFVVAEGVASDEWDDTLTCPR
ncbi:CAZyme family AA7 [Agaricus bisporus var. burnettii]|uniref:CAZyme family AA7 n=1 Tax=Agaricus bisporus var. burnettii TaxID=192524 RepID=A0A8H7F5J5_AGABI|nr:CAZyme family AA7 [Agaricus bisporus var. burnettii]